MLSYPDHLWLRKDHILENHESSFLYKSIFPHPLRSARSMSCGICLATYTVIGTGTLFTLISVMAQISKGEPLTPNSSGAGASQALRCVLATKLSKKYPAVEDYMMLQYPRGHPL